MIETSVRKPQPVLDEARLRELARTRLLAVPHANVDGHAAIPSDFDLNPDARPHAHETLTPAAVLVPIVTCDPLTVLLTERTAHLAAHAGQIAFPGGKIEPQDANALAAALREAREEIGLAPAFVEPLGYIEPYRTGTGFLVTPVIAAVRPGYQLQPDPDEVADIFTVPFGFLMDECNHRIDSRILKGAERRFYSMPYEGRYIWGVTAGIIRTLHRRLLAE